MPWRILGSAVTAPSGSYSIGGVPMSAIRSMLDGYFVNLELLASTSARYATFGLPVRVISTARGTMLANFTGRVAPAFPKAVDLTLHALARHGTVSASPDGHCNPNSVFEKRLGEHEAVIGGTWSIIRGVKMNFTYLTGQSSNLGFATSATGDSGSGHRFRRSSQALTAAVAAACLCLAGCSSGVIFNAGPLGGVGSTGINCAPVIGRNGVLSYGSIAFDNTSSRVRIDKVSLADPRGLRMLAAYVVPITGTDIYGLVPGYPTDKQLPRGIQWSERQRADGATIRHSPRQDSYNLIAVLRPTEDHPGWARGINIYYHSSDGQRYLLRKGLQILVGINSCPENLGRYERP